MFSKQIQKQCIQTPHRFLSNQYRTTPTTTTLLSTISTLSTTSTRTKCQHYTPKKQLQFQQQRTIFSSFRRRFFPTAKEREDDFIPDPYYGKYTPRKDPIPEGYWTQSPFGKPYFVGNTPEQEKLIQQAKDMKLYDGLEHPWNPTRVKDPMESFSFGIPGKYFGFILAAFWCHLFWDITGRTMTHNTINFTWRMFYLTKTDTLWPTNFIEPQYVEQYWPKTWYPKDRTKLLPPITDDEIKKFYPWAQWPDFKNNKHPDDDDYVDINNENGTNNNNNNNNIETNTTIMEQQPNEEKDDSVAVAAAIATVVVADVVAAVVV